MNKQLTIRTQRKLEELRMTHIQFWCEESALSLINTFEDIEKKKSQGIIKL